MSLFVTENKVQICSICKVDYAATRARAADGEEIRICDRCLEGRARMNVVVICLECRRVYLRPKSLFIEGAEDEAARRFYLGLLDELVIQGLHGCLSCDGERTPCSTLAI